MAQAPKELLYVLRQLEDWNEPHSERQLVSIPGSVSLLDLHLQLPHDINAFAFSKYVNIYLRGRTLFATKEQIRAPFLPKQTSMDQKDSLDAFKLILMYTADSNLTERRRRLVADMLIQKGLSSEPLRDEILVQLCNQTLYSGSGFCDPSSVWILLAGCLGSFQPSQSLAKYLLKYVSDTKSSLGYGVVCQHKLLQSQGIDTKCSRYYPPCILEWTAVRMKSCMALQASFIDGVTIKGQVESWTTAEQFASNLLQSRRASDGILGWCVVLRDDRESYECSGHDYLLDLISEIEVAPGFPCGTAYFIASSDLSRPTSASSIDKYKWPDQPHNADRLRLMPLDVEELADIGVFAPAPAPAPLPPPVRSPPPPVSPRSASLVPSLPSSPRDRTPSPEPPPTARSGDTYGSRDEAVSQFSVLNKRPEKVPGILSKSSALNNRYHMTNNDPPPAKKPQGVPPSGPGKAPLSNNGLGPGARGPIGGRPNGAGVGSRNGEDMDAWLEYVFHEVVNEGVDDLRNSNAVERRLKGGGDDLPSQLSLGNYGIGFNPYGLQAPPPVMSNSIFPQPIVTAPIMSSPFLQQQSVLPSSLQSSYLPQSTSSVPVLSLPDNSYLYQQQQQQRQQILTQQTAELQVRLQQQELEKKFMQSKVETEILRHQLHQVQEQTRPVVDVTRPVSSSYGHAPREVAPKHKQVPANSTRYPAGKAVHARAPQYIEDEEDEEEADDYDLQEPSPRPTRNRSTPASDPRPVSAPKPKKKSPAVASEARRTSDETAPLHPIIRNTTQEKAKGVTFSREVRTIDSSPVSPDADKPSPSFPAAGPPHPPAKPAKDSAGKDGKTTNGEKTENGIAAAMTAGALATATRPASGAMMGSQRRPPVKIGQIVWPPKPKEEETKPKFEPDRLNIHETKENQDKIRAKQTPDEAQRKVQEKIELARKKSAAEAAEREAGMAKQAAIRKRPSLNGPMSPDQMSPRDSVFDPPDSYHTLDMKSRQEALEKKLVQVSWGTQKKSDIPKAPILAAVAIPPPPPPPPPAPVADQVKIVAEVAEEQMTPFDLSSMDSMRTVLYAQCTDPFYTYHNVNWTLEIRKEFFRPMEKLSDPELLYLVFCQVVFDVSSNDCVRLSKDDRRKMTAMLDKHNVHPNNVGANHSQSAMVAIIEAAKGLPIYFSRIFAVNGGKRHRKVQMLAIGHSGVRLLTRFKDVCDDYIDVIETVGFSELLSVAVPKDGALLMRVTGKNFALYSPRANQICKMIEQFRMESNKISQAASKTNGFDVSRR